ncbi:hypothetical protein ES695_00780 [Candidatus Atribacteria bacterium 1244-E10-H5-B2]|nr:MAG: hypothetical protein ES695_00780 [Candidatus Atribacteria bacterium 1244-E10-H5-B2]
MIKYKSKRGVFDALLIKALGVEYIKFVISLSGSCKIPEGFPKEYGIRLYNEGIPAKVFEEVPPGLSVEELGRIKKDFESCLAVFREMTERAIAGQRPTKEDIRILEEILLKDKKLRIESYSKEKSYFYPSMYVNIPTGRALAFSWVYWVWIKDIKARKCKAKDCHKIFISVRSDQEYCSKRCAKRVWAQKNILEQ